MAKVSLPLPPNEAIRNHVREALSRYWPHKPLEPSIFPVLGARPVSISGPLRLVNISLPSWALAYGVQGTLLVPAEACEGGNDWQRVDWWLAVFLLLECWHERTLELNRGSIHSYSFRLEGWDVRVWEYAWVNRIALFMRAWAANEQGKVAADLFGPLPSSEVLMTHDVDATAKSVPIRLKQGAFNLLNAGRHLVHAEPEKALGKLALAMRFLFSREDWWTFDTLLGEERRAGIRAHFHFYADTRKKSLKRWLFDPGYDIRDERIRALMGQVQKENGVIGLHPSFDAWQSPELIRRQRQHLANVSSSPVSACRQHWLQFGWQCTWAAQEQAGIETDATLMFNDRPGFRASAALAWQPWNQQAARPHRLRVQPTAMMDSHFYDYQTMDATQRAAGIQHWIDETRAVGGQIAVLWHPHTLTRDYGWTDGFQELLHALAEPTPCRRLH